MSSLWNVKKLTTKKCWGSQAVLAFNAHFKILDSNQSSCRGSQAVLAFNAHFKILDSNQSSCRGSQAVLTFQSIFNKRYNNSKYQYIHSG